MKTTKFKAWALNTADLHIRMNVDGIIMDAFGDAQMLCADSAEQLILGDLFQILDVQDIGLIRRSAAALTAGERISFDDPKFGDHGRRILVQRDAENGDTYTVSLTELKNHQILNRDRVEEHHVRAFRHAVAERDLKAALQPIVHTSSGDISHYEVLVRFPFEGSPAPFIAAAERAGLISHLDILMVDAAAHKLSCVGGNMHLSVNISGDTIQRTDLVDILVRAIDDHDFDANRLIIELTESSEIVNIETAAANVDRLRSTGVRVVLDDFGAGAASFGYLRYLNVDGVKFDGCFLATEASNVRNNALLRSIAGMCSELGMSAVGERVETEEDRQTLLKAGVTLAQGWLFGRPVIDDAFFERKVATTAAA